MAEALELALDARRVRVERFDPRRLWSDPIERMALAIAQEVECLVCVRLGKPLSEFVAEEVTFAKKAGIPVLFVDDDQAIDAIANEVSLLSAPDVDWATPHELFVAVRDHWLWHEERLGETEAVAIAIGTSNSSSEHLRAALIVCMILVSPLASALSILFSILAICLSPYFVIASVALVTVAALARRIMFKALAEQTYADVIRKKRAWRQQGPAAHEGAARKH